jgi:hypothetical protein
MTNLESAVIHGAKVLGHVALSAAVTAVFAFINHNPQIMLYTPVVNVAEAFLWKLMFPNDPLPVAKQQ